MNEDKSEILTLNEQKVFEHGYAMGKADAYEKAFHYGHMSWHQRRYGKKFVKRLKTTSSLSVKAIRKT